jgi:type II secretion system protein N
VLHPPGITDAREATWHWHRYRTPLAYALFGVILFASFLFATFPYSATLSKVLAPMGYQFSSTSQQLNFPFGAQLTDVRINPLTSSGHDPMIECPVMTIAPSLLSILMLQPGVRVKANLYDGIARATIRPSSGGTAITYDLDAMNISEQHLFTLPVGSASGTVSGTGKLWLSPQDLTTDIGKGELDGKELEIKSDFLNAPIRLGTGQATFNLDHGLLTIENLKTTGADLTLTATGTIQLSPNPADSTIAIQFTLIPTPSAASRLALLFHLLPHPPGPQPYNLTGTLNSPRIS